jgi:hypothetical protein
MSSSHPAPRLRSGTNNELVGLGQTPDTFDLRTENVLVSSDSSFTETGMSAEKKARIRAAMRALGL